MPDSTSPSPNRPYARAKCSPSRPHQLPRMASRPSGEFISAGVHSVVWIFAISAALTSRAFWKSHSPSAAGCSTRSRSTIELCSRAKIVCMSDKPDPPVSVHAGELLAGRLVTWMERQKAVRLHSHLAVGEERAGLRIGAHLQLARGERAIDLRRIPPVRLAVVIDSWPAFIARTPRVGRGLQDRHPPVGPVVSVRHREFVLHRRIVVAVAQPVVHHELQPCRHEQIEVRHGHEALALQQLFADQARVRIVKAGFFLAETVRDRHVAAEARAGHAHPGLAEVVVAAVDGPLVANVYRRLRRQGMRGSSPCRTDCARAC